MKQPSNTNKFALTPDNEPPRLIRFVDTLQVPLLALYHQTENLLVVSREQYAKLTEAQQHILVRTHEPVTEIAEEEWADWPALKQAAE
jgi:hypothetical protein